MKRVGSLKLPLRRINPYFPFTSTRTPSFRLLFLLKPVLSLQLPLPLSFNPPADPTNIFFLTNFTSESVDNGFCESLTSRRIIRRIRIQPTYWVRVWLLLGVSKVVQLKGGNVIFEIGFMIVLGLTSGSNPGHGELL